MEGNDGKTEGTVTGVNNDAEEYLLTGEPRRVVDLGLAELAALAQEEDDDDEIGVSTEEESFVPIHMQRTPIYYGYQCGRLKAIDRPGYNLTNGDIRQEPFFSTERQMDLFVLKQTRKMLKHREDKIMARLYRFMHSRLQKKIIERHLDGENSHIDLPALPTLVDGKDEKTLQLDLSRIQLRMDAIDQVIAALGGGNGNGNGNGSAHGVHKEKMLVRA